MWKRLIHSLALCAVAAVLLLPAHVRAGGPAAYSEAAPWTRDDAVLSGAVNSGACGENAVWELDEEGTLTISGTGVIEDSSFYVYSGVNEIVIEDGITGIGDYAFAWCGMERISIPDSVSSIGAYAFLLCESLEEIQIPASVRNIGESAFRACSALTAFVVQEGNPNYSSLDGVLFNKGRTELICYAPAKAASVYTLPDSVSGMASDAFNRCFQLEALEAGSGNAAYASQDGVLFSRDFSKLVRYPAGKRNAAYSLPDTVTHVEEFAFYDSALTELTVGTQLAEIGSRAFYDCKVLETVEYLGTAAQWAEIKIGEGNDVITGGGVAIHCSDSESILGYGTCGSDLRWVLDYKGTLTISGTGAMEDYSLYTKIEAGRPSYSYMTYPWNDVSNKIKALVVQEGVTQIGNMAFGKIPSLKTATLPLSLRQVVYGAFYQTGLTDVYYAGTQEQWRSVGKGQDNGPLTSAQMHYNQSDGSSTSTVISTPAVSGDTVTVSITCGEQASVWFAVYGEGGKFLGAEQKALSAGGESQLSFTIEDKSAKKFTLLVLAEDGLKPLCASLEREL